MSVEQRLSDIELVVKNIIDDAIKIGGLPPLLALVNLNDEIALDIKSTGQTVKTSISQLISGGVGTTVIKQLIDLPFSFPLNNKTDLNNLHGTLASFAGSGIILNSGTPITWTCGQSRVFFNVIAGTDVNGSLTITGTSVDRDTGVETAADTEIITINGLTTDTSSSDSNSNVIHGFSNAYISTKWFKDGITVSTTDLDISNVVIFQSSYEQFVDSPNIQLVSFDTTYDTLNTNAEMDMYLYAVEVVDNVATVTKISQQNQSSGGAIRNYRHKRTLTKNLDGTMDGVFLDLFLKPDNLQYFSSFITKIWAEITKNINVVIDGSLGLDNITYGEILQIGDLVYLESNGKYLKADNTSESTSTTELRLIIEAGVLDDVKLSLAKGQFSGTGFTAGNEYVGTNGAITNTRPLLSSEVVRIVSTSIDATTRYFDPSKTWIAGDASKINGVSLPGISNDVIDNIHTILNSADQTKKFQFELSLITSGIKRIGKVQDKDGVFAYLSDVQSIIDGEVSIHNQSVAALTWNFNHNLNILNPNIQIWDSSTGGAKVLIPLEIIAVDVDNAQIIFPVGEPASGRAVATRGGTNTASLTSAINTLAKLNAVVADATLIDKDDSDNVIALSELNFSAKSAPAHSTGKLFYDEDGDELAFYNSESDVKLNIGTEIWIKVRNNSGDTIPSFTPVYQTGAIGNRATIDLAKADSESTSGVIGITTHEIENNSNGFITIIGTINGEDTDGSPFSESWGNGDEIFLSAITAGDMTKVAPTSNNIVVSLGSVLTAANNGSFDTKIDGANVRGATGSTDNALTRFDGTSGKRIQNSAVILDDSGNISGVVDITLSGVLIGDEIVNFDNLADELKARVVISASEIDWSLGEEFTKTLGSNLTITDSNLPTGTDTKCIVAHLTGEFTVTAPSYWVNKGGTYDGTKSNMYVVDCLNGNVSSEIVNYIIVTDV